LSFISIPFYRANIHTTFIRDLLVLKFILIILFGTKAQETDFYSYFLIKIIFELLLLFMQVQKLYSEIGCFVFILNILLLKQFYFLIRLIISPA